MKMLMLTTVIFLISEAVFAWNLPFFEGEEEKIIRAANDQLLKDLNAYFQQNSSKKLFPIDLNLKFVEKLARANSDLELMKFQDILFGKEIMVVSIDEPNFIQVSRNRISEIVLDAKKLEQLPQILMHE